ncbi:hypothetical protein AB0D13_27135 [Streptomyces sp. NPDC048430]|uniref:hypothetical protein n=1 Tax=Streptomyces sp. NPDC048430 TaxID=3155388 RepID=UPI00343AD73E
MDRRLIQTAVFGSSDSDDPAVCPETVEELETFRREHTGETIWCGTKFEGGCGRQLATRLCTNRICHFAHYASDGSTGRCGRKAKDKDSANHLFAKAHLAAWLHTQGQTAEFSYPEPLGSAVQVELHDGRTLLLHLDRNRPVNWDNGSWEVILGPGVRVPPYVLEQRGYVQRIRFEDRPGGGRMMRLGTEHPGEGTTWDGLEDVHLTAQGLNTSTRPNAVRSPMPEPIQHSEPDMPSIVSIAPSRSRAGRTARQGDPVKSVVMHLDRAMRDQPDRLHAAVSAIQRLLEKEQSPENIGRLRLALDRGRPELERRVRHRQGILAQLRVSPTAPLLAEVTPLMRDLDVTAEERETVRAARVRHYEDEKASRLQQASLAADRQAREERDWFARTAQQQAERREQVQAERSARAEQARIEQRERVEAAQQEHAEKVEGLALFVLGALKKAARENRVTTWLEIRDKTGKRDLGRLTHQDKLAILQIVERRTPPDHPLWSAVLAAAGGDDALRLHRDVLLFLQRPAPDDDADLLVQVNAECARLRSQ